MSVFRFKRFSVKQTNSAAKITTDATIMAAYLPVKQSDKSVLEVGTGTGVMSLILAQRYPNIMLDAVELEPSAYHEANNNFRESPWSDRLNPILADFKSFRPATQYDLIFSNPPFFNNNLKSEINDNKNIAYHTDTLSFKDLAEGLNYNLTENGVAFVMLPFYEMKLFQKEMEGFGFKMISSLAIRHQEGSKVIRIIAGFSKEADSDFVEEEIYVKDENNNFHPSYVKLLNDFLIIF